MANVEGRVPQEKTANPGTDFNGLLHQRVEFGYQKTITCFSASERNPFMLEPLEGHFGGLGGICMGFHLWKTGLPWLV